MLSTALTGTAVGAAAPVPATAASIMQAPYTVATLTSSSTTPTTAAHATTSLRHQLATLIDQALRYRVLDDARFYAERLFADCHNSHGGGGSGSGTGGVGRRSCQNVGDAVNSSDDDDEESWRERSLYLLAEVHLQCGDVHAAHGVLRQAIAATVDHPTSKPNNHRDHRHHHNAPHLRSFRCRYLLAHCFRRLKNDQEAELVLDSIVETATDGSDAVSGDNVTSRDATTDDALAAVYHMLGEICRDGGRVKLAIDHFQKALQLNPCSMAAFEKLAALGVNMTMTGGECGQQQRQRADACRAWLAKRSGACSGAGVVAAGRVPHVTLLSKDGRGASSSCSNGNTVEHVTSAPALVVPSRPASVTSRRPPKPASDTSTTTTTATTTATARRSNRSVTNTVATAVPVVAAKIQQPLIREKKRTRSGNAKTAQLRSVAAVMQDGDATCEDVAAVDASSADEFLKIFHLTTSAVAHQQQFNFREALNALTLLPSEQQETGWVVALKARCHFENVDYVEACRLYARLRQLEPYRMRDMDRYSSALWQLQRTTELSHLAHELLAISPNHHPQTWCAMGNYYAVQKEHDAAIRCFERALKIDEGCAYAHNLCGHEHHANDALDKAMVHFRTALRLDPRMYNAWFGLGRIYYKQEKWDQAGYHFRKALSINRTSTILCYLVGGVLFKEQRHAEALQYFDRAIQLDPRNTQAKYRKAEALLALNRPQLALTYFTDVANVAPNEPLVHQRMGAILKQLGRPAEALRSYLYAMDLDPKAAHAMRDAIGGLHVDDGDMAEDLFGGVGSAL